MAKIFLYYLGIRYNTKLLRDYFQRSKVSYMALNYINIGWMYSDALLSY